MAKQKTIVKEGHYRRVMKSEHLGVADLEDFLDQDKPLVFTIDYVQQEYDVQVAGKLTKGNFAYFKENIKPLMLNSINQKRIREFVPNRSPFIEHWKNIIVEFYIDENVKFGNEKTGGVRIKATQPQQHKKVSPTDEQFQKTLAAVVAGTYSKEKVLEKMELTEEQSKALENV